VPNRGDIGRARSRSLPPVEGRLTRRHPSAVCRDLPNRSAVASGVEGAQIDGLRSAGGRGPFQEIDLLGARLRSVLFPKRASQICEYRTVVWSRFARPAGRRQWPEAHLLHRSWYRRRPHGSVDALLRRTGPRVRRPAFAPNAGLEYGHSAAARSAASKHHLGKGAFAGYSSGSTRGTNHQQRATERHARFQHRHRESIFNETTASRDALTATLSGHARALPTAITIALGSLRPTATG
jgi:hypothetical protein